MLWNFCSPIESEVLTAFEEYFDFHINPPLRDFLLTHNGGKTRHCNIPTNMRERRMDSILDFSKEDSAYAITRRMRRILGNKIIVIGKDRSDNFLCVQRDMRKQNFVIWNHITNALEECTLEIPILVMCWQSEEV